MIDFSRSTFTWKSQPWKADSYYRWQGGFVGTEGQVYQVRFTLDARCHVHHDDSGESTELFLGAPCRSEYTIASCRADDTDYGNDCRRSSDCKCSGYVAFDAGRHVDSYYRGSVAGECDGRGHAGRQSFRPERYGQQRHG